MQHRPKRWNVLPDPPAADELAAKLKVSPLIARIMLQRGINETDDCRRFLRPSLQDLHRPELIANLPRAADRIARAIRDKKKAVIYGDYDVDGITASAILWHTIRTLGGVVDYYIPHRIDEGYGLNAAALIQICDDGADLIVSVDCGVTAIEPAKVCAGRGVDLIITDHHEWKVAEEWGVGSGEVGREQTGPISLTATPPLPTPHSPLLPACHSVVHPRLLNDGKPYPNVHLCGAGVAFKLAWGIGQAMSGGEKVSDAFRAFLLDATALAALGTIADVVPLVGENRTLAYFGLGGLKQSKLVGLRALVSSAGLTGQNLSSFDVGFKLAPRLNACGRMGYARVAVDLLTTTDEAKALDIATMLEGQNRQRQAMEKKITEQAVQQVIDLKLDADTSAAIVLGDADWHPGVIGIVASRMVDRFHRPAVMVALNNGHGQGSGRSIAGFHLAKAFSACGTHLESHGGHEMAAGLKVRTESFEAFRAAFSDHARSLLRPEDLVPELKLDAVAELDQVTEALVADLHRLGPFGHGNRRPVFCCRGVTVAAPPRRVGKTGDHLQLLVRQGEVTIKCIAFSLGKLDVQLRTGTTIDLAVEPTINEFNGCRTVELEVKDLQISGVTIS